MAMKWWGGGEDEVSKSFKVMLNGVPLACVHIFVFY